MIVCSAITAADFPHAQVMATSVKTHMPESKVVICLVERTMPPEIEGFQHFDKVLLAKDLGFQWPDLNRIIFKYNAVEGVSAVKGQLMKDLMHIYPEQAHFVYLDPKMKMISPCNELASWFQYHSILLTPHQLFPHDIEREHELLNEGTFESGFIAVKRSDNGTKFIEWFTDRLNRFYEDPYKGQKLDKKFLNLVMGGFDLFVVKHPGYNVGIWNLHERVITHEKDGTITVNGSPLRLFNFTNLENWQLNQPNLGYPFLRKEPSKLPWSYDYYYSGEKIAREIKVRYRQNPDSYNDFADLFAESNASLLKNDE